jgi:hypothetical protein
MTPAPKQEKAMLRFILNCAQAAYEGYGEILFHEAPPMMSMEEYERRHEAEIRAQLERDASAAVRELAAFERRMHAA